MNAEHEQSSGKKTLVDTLLAIDSRMPTSSAEGREVAKEVLRRDRRRVRILTWMTIAFVLLVTIGIYGSFLMFYTYITPKMDKCAEEISKLEPLAGAELTTARSCQAL
jgi:predicted MFS family arabinose efflux permease